MASSSGRAQKLQRLDALNRARSIDGAVRQLRGNMRELHTEVGDLRGEVGELRGKVDGLSGQFHQLRLVVETHGREIATIREVLGHHGTQFDQISKSLQPLREIKEFIDLVAHDHERRISALERRPHHPE